MALRRLYFTSRLNQFCWNLITTLRFVIWLSSVRKHLYRIHDSHSPFHREMYIRLLVQCHLRPIWLPVLALNLTYFEISSSAALSGPALYTLLIFQVPNLISIFFRFGHLSKETVQFRGSLWSFVTSLVFMVRNFCPTPNAQAGESTLSSARDCLFNIHVFATTLHIWKESPPAATWGRAMPWWQGTQLTRGQSTADIKVKQ
jgi:hypothetical protein